MEFDSRAFVAAIYANLKYKDTLRKLSGEIGVSVPTMSRVMKGKDAQLSTILKICNWLNQPITDFIISK